MIDERIKKIAEHYGFGAQAQKTIEESSELITAIVKFQNFRSHESFVHLIEEVVDVGIMIEQLKLFICSTKEDNERYEKTREYKLNRQIKRICSE